MRSHRLLFVAGSDAPGLIHHISRFIYEHECNIADSRMSVLGGQGAMMMLVAGTEAALARLENELGHFETRENLRAMMAPAGDTGVSAREPCLPVGLEVVAMDSPGILVQLAERLEQLGVNVDALDARLSSAPASAATISSVKLKLSVPQSIPLQQVKEALQKLAVRINLDIAFHPYQE